MQHPTGQRRPEFRGARVAMAACLMVALGAVWSCSVEKHYKTLSFFFDGVPDPEAKAKVAAAGGIALDMHASPTYSIHKPYAEGACVECHAKSFDLGTQDSALCLKCHLNRTTEYPKMHGPVAAVACLWCHTPHESPEAHLLKKPARQVCAQCHEPATLNAVRVPEHADATRSCLDCHSGHGGTASFFLRPAESRSGPGPKAAATEPTTR